jgi:copper chaperone CopZ
MKRLAVCILFALSVVSAFSQTDTTGIYAALQQSKKKKTETVTITYDPAKTNPETLRKAIEKLGYKVE